MIRYIAFLRAINVGGHFIKMERLRQIFLDQGMSNVETFINSGNVIFESRARVTQSLEAKMESALSETLGYTVNTFIRTQAELSAIASHPAFLPEAAESAATNAIGFLATALEVAAVERLMALRSQNDDFHVHNRELYWLSRRRQSESAISGAVIERTLNTRTTIRGLNTVRQMATKYGV